MPTDLSQFGLGDPNGTVDAAGTFTPASSDPTASQGSALNPYVDPGPWGFVEIGGFRLPGVVRSIDGAEKPEEWSVQKASAKSNATTVWKGTKLAESIKIGIELPNREAFARYYELALLLRPKIGTKPPSHVVANPIINFSGITRVSTGNVAPPKPSANNSWFGEVTLVEYNPEKDANTGPAGGAKPPAGADPNADVKAELQKALDAAAAA